MIEKAICKNCQWCTRRPDTKKKIMYCIKRNFAILNLDADGCTKYIRRKTNG